MAWTRVGLDIGVAGGATLAGLLIDRGGAADGFMVTTAAGISGLVIMLASWRYLRRTRAYDEEVSRDEPVAA